MTPAYGRQLLAALTLMLTCAVLAGAADTPAAKARNTPGTPPPVMHEALPRRPLPEVLPEESAQPLPRGDQRRGRYVSVQVNVDPFGLNIDDDAANEPSLAIDPTNPLHMVIGWRQFDTRFSNFREAGWAYSHDGGQSWTFPGVLEDGVFRSDPVLATDTAGNFYYYSLSTFGTCELFKSTDGGVTWSDAVPGWGGDKIWMDVDNTGGIGNGNVYLTWQRFFNCCDVWTFARSIDSGESFEFPNYMPRTPSFGSLTVGPDGEVYVFGIDAEDFQNWAQFVVSKSTDARNPESAVYFYTTPVDIGGIMDLGAAPNPAGMTGQAWVTVDRSEGPTRGYVYLLCSVDPPGDDPMDVMFARSTDGGVTWSTPLRINDDPLDTNTWQWFGTLSVAPNGRLDVIWNDTRNGLNHSFCETFHSYSLDAGLTWSTNEPITPQFNSYYGFPQQNKLGDYYHMVSDNAGAHLAYAATFNIEQDVYYLYIPFCADAGTVSLNRAAYACESTADIAVLDCGLNTDPEIAESVEVTVTSDSELAGERIVLTETAVDSALFEAQLDLSGIDAEGVLLVAPGDTVTVTYIDADDGAGGIDVEVLESAQLDCTAPQVTGVQITDIRTRDAMLYFETDEPTIAMARFGTSSDDLYLSTPSSSFVTQHTLRLTGMDGENLYYLLIDVEDQAGNVTTADNGGTGYTFETPRIPQHFTEFFWQHPNDFSNHSLALTPDGGPDYYSACVRAATSLPTDPTGGTILELADDATEYVIFNDGAMVQLYGMDYGGCFVSSNGNITFAYADASSYWHPSNHFSQPRISALFCDLNPEAGGSVSWKQRDDRIAITWLEVPHVQLTEPNTAQIEMFYDGRITVTCVDLEVQWGMVGISEGLGYSFDYYETDLTELGGCGELGDLNCDGVLDSYDIDAFICALSPNCDYYAEWPTCDINLADCNGDGNVNAYDIDAFVQLMGGGG
ncbi:MAG: hypothetical protein ABIG44_18605 [Planctomycetota bacterium]